MKKLIKIQFFVLLIGTIFAWTNFTLELFAWLNQKTCTTGCSLNGPTANPFLTACFYGAIFFAVAFVLNLLVMIAARPKKEKTPAHTTTPASPAPTV